jgi:formate/nitrite transporter FocA (FNT family)
MDPKEQTREQESTGGQWRTGPDDGGPGRPRSQVKGREQVEEEEVQERAAPSGKIVYRAILKEGREELERPSSALFWSGIAAGSSMGFSLITEGLLRAHLPDAEWRPLVAKFGYSIGFLIVVLGRQQLFTENTLTPVLPLLVEKERRAYCFKNIGRLWGIVLLANLLGALAVAWAIGKGDVFEPEVRAAFLAIGHEALGHSFLTTMLKGIFAGWLIALMVWLLPFAEAARFFVIITITYVVGIGQFSHVVAGAAEAFHVALAGEKGWGEVLGGFIVPTLIGNILGGVTLVAALNHAQVTAGGDGQDL